MSNWNASQQQTLSSKALVSLILGILGLVALPIIGPVGAIWLAKLAEVEVSQDPSLSGRELAKAGRVLGWLSLGLTACGAVLAIIWLIFVFVTLGGGGGQ